MLAGIRRPVVQIKAIGKDDLLLLGAWSCENLLVPRALVETLLVSLELLQFLCLWPGV
jgi:hypothetical protein